MRPFSPVGKIEIPAPKPDPTYTQGEFSFHGLKRLLGAADYDKAGDRNAGLAAANDTEREAARACLSALTLQHLYDHPLTASGNHVDSVMRVNYDIDRESFSRIAGWTLGELKDWLLGAPPAGCSGIGRGLTGVMAAALAKILDVHELIYVARKMPRSAKARTTLGLPGTLSSRLQPNHPYDDPRAVSLLVYTGLSQAAGDALIGINPAVDTVDNVETLLRHLHRLREQTGAPTQICVLAHLKTQLACLERGAPVEILFQSLAGTESTLLTEFDVSIEQLDAAYHTMRARGALGAHAPQFMYFETGQGSEFTYGKHNGIDMTTTEALCYGLARRYDPFMVNNVTGFIGPETHLNSMEMILSNLQDHFMGKLLGLPMGMAPCYTLHSQIDLDGQQIATQLLTAAGANYFMDVHLNTDRMLAYFDTSGHDDQTLREVHHRTPAPEFLQWAVGKGILAESGGAVVRGPRWGNPGLFCNNDAELENLARVTPAIYPFESAGPRPCNDTSRKLRGYQAVSRGAIYRELDIESLLKVADFRLLTTMAHTKMEHLNSPALGAQLSPECVLGKETFPVQIVVSDGLSADAVHRNLPELFPILQEGLTRKGIPAGKPWLVRYGRVKLTEPISEALDARLTIMLVGERPGGDAQSACSLSAYFVYRLAEPEVQKRAATVSGNPDIAFESTVVSNIYESGLPPMEAASVIVEKAAAILAFKAAGNRLEALLESSRERS